MRPLLFLLLVGILTACATSASSKRVVGVYRAASGDFNFGGELTMNPDFTYSFKWTAVSHYSIRGQIWAREEVEEGRWKMESDGVLFWDGIQRKNGGSPKNCFLWGRYTITGESLNPVRDKAGQVTFRRKEPNK